jgi:hypothetical protein
MRLIPLHRASGISTPGRSPRSSAASDSKEFIIPLYQTQRGKRQKIETVERGRNVTIRYDFDGLKPQMRGESPGIFTVGFVNLECPRLPCAPSFSIPHASGC